MYFRKTIKNFRELDPTEQKRIQYPWEGQYSTFGKADV